MVIIDQKILSIDIGKKNMGFCLFDGSELIFGLFDIDSNTTMKNMLGRNLVLVQWFRRIFEQHENIHIVVIEKQVVNNVVAMCIQSSIISIVSTMRPDVDIICYDPKNKFVYTNDHYNSKAKEHKKLSIKYAESILKYLRHDLEYFRSFHKQDDISDAIVMAFIIQSESYVDQSDIKSILKFDK